MRYPSSAPPWQPARSATAERESYEAIFLKENRGDPMRYPSPASPRESPERTAPQREHLPSAKDAPHRSESSGTP